MRILLTTYDLTRRGGTQMFAADLARKLLEKGHEPVVHSPQVGPVAAEIRTWAIPVTPDLRTITVPPDVIIGNYHLGTMTALHRFPSAPAIFVCHGTDAPVPRAPRILRYVAVDESCRTHMTSECGIESSRIETVLSSVDLSRFQRRGPLPASPRRALLLGNEFEGDRPWRLIERVCREMGIATDVIGEGSGRTESHPERHLHQYDLVFGRGRSALEAMATGAATILAGPNRMASLVTTSDLERLRSLNFGRRALTIPITAEVVRREILRYDPSAAASVCETIRAVASIDGTAAEFIRLAEDVVAEAVPADIALEYAATADYLAGLESDLPHRIEMLRLRIERFPLVGRLALGVGRRLMRWK